MPLTIPGMSTSSLTLSEWQGTTVSQETIGTIVQIICKCRVKFNLILVSEEVWYRVIQIVVNREDVQGTYFNTENQ